MSCIDDLASISESCVSFVTHRRSSMAWSGGPAPSEAPCDLSARGMHTKEVVWPRIRVRCDGLHAARVREWIVDDVTDGHLWIGL